MRRLVIVGAGGFGREVVELVSALANAGEAWEIEGFIDDFPSPETTELLAGIGSHLIGDVDTLAARDAPCHAVLAIGEPRARQAVLSRLSRAPLSYPTLVHPASSVGASVRLGHGVVIAAGARLSAQIHIGAHVHIDQNATVGHDARIEDFVRLNPQACLSGSVSVARGALIGANATILQGLRVGQGAVVGAGAVVTRDVPDGTIVKGVPAR